MSANKPGQPPPEQRDDSFLLSLLSQYSGGAKAAAPPAKAKKAAPAPTGPTSVRPPPRPSPLVMAAAEDDLGEVYTPQLASAAQSSSAISLGEPPRKKRKLDAPSKPAPAVAASSSGSGKAAGQQAGQAKPASVVPETATAAPADEASLPAFALPISSAGSSEAAAAPPPAALPALLLSMYSSNRQRGVTAEALATRLQRPMLLDSAPSTTFLASVGANAWDAETRLGKRAAARALRAAAAATAGRPQAAADGGSYLNSAHGVVCYSGSPPRYHTKAMKAKAAGQHPLGRTHKASGGAGGSKVAAPGPVPRPELSLAVVLTAHASWCAYVCGLMTTAAVSASTSSTSAGAGAASSNSAGRGMVTLEALKAQEAGRRDVVAATGQGAERLKMSGSGASSSAKASVPVSLPGLSQTQSLITPSLVSLLDWHFAFLTVTRCVSDPSLVGTTGYVVTDGAAHFVLYQPPLPAALVAADAAPAPPRWVTVPKDGSWFAVSWPVPARFSVVAAGASGGEGREGKGRAMGALLDKLVKTAKKACSSVAGGGERDEDAPPPPGTGSKLEVASSLLPACTSAPPLDVLYKWLDTTAAASAAGAGSSGGAAASAFAQRLVVELVGATLLKPAVHPSAQRSTPLSAVWAGGPHGPNSLFGRAKALPRRAAVAGK